MTMFARWGRGGQNFRNSNHVVYGCSQKSSFHKNAKKITISHLEYNIHRQRKVVLELYMDAWF